MNKSIKYQVSSIMYIGLAAFLPFILYTLYFIHPVEAHLPGQPPFFKINDIYSDLYPVPTSSWEGFELPQDIAPKSYLVNEKINFEIDRSQIPVLPSIIDKTTFHWDFGDGAKGTGEKNIHSYQKPGSYILKIQAQYQQDIPQLLQSTLINIVPYEGFELPKAIISVDGFITTDPLIDPYVSKLENELTFDATKSKSPSRIVFYEWDLGDGESSTEKVLKHKYLKNYGQFYPVLRIKTEDGFIADTYIEIKKDDGKIGSTLTQTQRKLNTQTYDVKSKIAVGAFVVISFVILFFIIRGLKKKIK